MENKWRILQYTRWHGWFPLPGLVYRFGRRPHGVDVDAESLYEAVAIAVAQEDDVSPLTPGPTTEFTVAVCRNTTEHKLRLSQVTKWAEPTTKDGPAGITKRQRGRALLNG
jgi:hypothetical protein